MNEWGWDKLQVGSMAPLRANTNLLNPFAFGAKVHRLRTAPISLRSARSARPRRRTRVVLACKRHGGSGSQWAACTCDKCFLSGGARGRARIVPLTPGGRERVLIDCTGGAGAGLLLHLTQLLA